ncbi:MAG: SDR family NAD(P)-dependent oxidoreductase [Tannerella sp.]|jgi:NADP-dependent 3-hydroxy acid dehydrogenase YdfG|nr:SDR family NAD(P)-dependent oxidoreductase [Tannerella sp.]
MKKAFITGATAGIGKAIALRLAKENYALILTGRRAERLEALKEELERDYHSKVHTLCFDVRVFDQVEQAVASLPDEWKTIDILVNNAGLAAGLDPIHTALVSDWDQMIDTNIKGLLYVTRVVAPGMLARKSGHIINLGSIAGRANYPSGSVYCATKHAVKVLSEGMRMDFLPYGIRVTEIAPGAVETEFSIVRFKGDKQRAGQVYMGFNPLVAEDIAEAVYCAISQSPHINLQEIVIMPTAQASPTLIHREIR